VTSSTNKRGSLATCCSELCTRTGYRSSRRTGSWCQLRRCRGSHSPSLTSCCTGCCQARCDNEAQRRCRSWSCTHERTHLRRVLEQIRRVRLGQLRRSALASPSS
jgi:hypothetical protein